MSKKNQPPADQQNDTREPVAMNKRWYWIRASLVAVLVFIFVMWVSYPTRGNVAILWAAGLAAAILGYFAFSYYMLNR
jgi:hypothetical protein